MRGLAPGDPAGVSTVLMWATPGDLVIGRFGLVP
jgi:hypothetical protein